jgi:hypothetical protein
VPEDESAQTAPRIQVVVWAAVGTNDLVDLLMESDGPIARLDPERHLGKWALMFYDRGWQRVRNALGPAGQGALVTAKARVAADSSGATGLVLVMYGESRPFTASTEDECWMTVAGSPEGFALLKLHVSMVVADRLLPFLGELGQRVPLLCRGAWGGCRVGLGPAWTDARGWFVRQVGPTQVNGPLWITVAGSSANERFALLSPQLLDGVVGRCGLPNGGGIWQLDMHPAGPVGARLNRWLDELVAADLMCA